MYVQHYTQETVSFLANVFSIRWVCFYFIKMWGKVV